MADDRKKPDSVLVSPQAFVAMLVHAAQHRSSQTHGILVGSHSGGTIHVADAIPVCHETPTKTLVDTSLALVQAQQVTDSTKVVGWFTGPEILEDDRPPPVALRISANLPATDVEPVLLVLRNEEVANVLSGDKVISPSKVLSAFGKDFGKQWMEPLVLKIDKESSATELARETYQQGIVLNDLVDHLEDPMLSEWHPKNSKFVTLVQKYS